LSEINIRRRINSDRLRETSPVLSAREMKGDGQ
jgi:hypothetical protein